MIICYEGHEHAPTQTRYRNEVSAAAVKAGAVPLSATGTDYYTGEIVDGRPVVACLRAHPSYTPTVVDAVARACPLREVGCVFKTEDTMAIRAAMMDTIAPVVYHIIPAKWLPVSENPPPVSVEVRDA